VSDECQCVDCQCEPKLAILTLQPILPPEEPKQSILEQAENAVSQRMAAYGPPTVNHERTALFWKSYLRARYGIVFPLDAEAVAWMNVLQKMSREMHSKTDDGLVDVAGYVRNIEMLREAD
jgi:hypothetical protein